MGNKRRGSPAEIDGIKYELNLWSTTEALGWHDRMIKLGLGPAIALFMADSSPVMADMPGGQAQAQTPGLAIAASLHKNLGPGGVTTLIQELLSGVFRWDQPLGEDGEPDDEAPPKRSPVVGTVIATKRGTAKRTDDFELYYRGKTFHLYNVAWWVIEANLGDFIEGSRSIVKGRQQHSAIVSLAQEASDMAEDGDEQGAMAAMALIQAEIKKAAAQTQDPD